MKNVKNQRKRQFFTFSFGWKVKLIEQLPRYTFFPMENRLNFMINIKIDLLHAIIE